MSSLQPGDPGHPEVADTIAGAVLRVPGVAGLHTGRFGEVATYLPGRRVGGVRLAPGVVEVHVTVTYGAPVLDTADLVHAAVAPLVDHPVEVTVEDILGPGAEPAP